MTTTYPAPRLPSLDVVRAELESLLAEQERRATSFDSRAGLILGFCGVLIGLTSDGPSLLQILGQACAVIASGFAGWSLSHRVAGAIEPRALRDRYLTVELAMAKLMLLDTRIHLFEQAEVRLQAKVLRLRTATWALGVALLLMLAGSIVEYVR